MIIQKTFKSQTEALAYLDQYIPQDKEFKFPGEIGLARQTYLLELLGDPQNKLKVIHVAGTSGKGSTSYFISIALKSLGFTVGLSVSPILLDIKERFQINNEMISDSEFCKYLTEIIPAVEQVSGSSYGKPTYYEVLVALTYYIFEKKQLDYAVIETGLGGLLDGTNVVTNPNKIAVITQIGHDHTQILGNTLDKIAYQKAGIIHRGNIVVVIKQNPTVLKVIENTVKREHAILHIVGKEVTSNISISPSPKFDFTLENDDIKNIELAMLGTFQIQNCSLALSVVTYLSQRDNFVVNGSKVRLALLNAVFTGRMQQITISGQQVVLDGAHNPQKMSMLAKNLKLYFPHQRFTFMVSLRRGKNYQAILAKITPIAKQIIVAPFESQTRKQGFSAMAEDTKVISKIFTKLQYSNYILCKSSREGLELLQKDKSTTGVITGSLYLLSEIYTGLIAQNVSQVQLPILG